MGSTSCRLSLPFSRRLLSLWPSIISLVWGTRVFYGQLLGTLQQAVMGTSYHGMHCCDVIMGAVASQITSLTTVYSTVYPDADQRKKTSKLHVTGLCVGNSPGTGEFPAQMASNAEMFPFDDVIMEKRQVQKLRNDLTKTSGMFRQQEKQSRKRLSDMKTMVVLSKLFRFRLPLGTLIERCRLYVISKHFSSWSQVPGVHEDECYNLSILLDTRCFNLGKVLGLCDYRMIILLACLQVMMFHSLIEWS